MTMEEQLRKVRKRLRMAMNGIVSNSLRQKGMNYKLIFGVPLPEIKEIAKSFEMNADFARALWSADVREMKILATMLFPPSEMERKEACQWAAAIVYPELAEQCCNNLFPKVADPAKLAVDLLGDRESPYGRTAGFLLFAQLFKLGKPVEKAGSEVLLAECECVLQPEEGKPLSISERMAVVQALKFYGRQSAEQAQQVLALVRNLPDHNPDTGSLLYDELAFEFEYYQTSKPGDGK